jgi:glyoxylase-like metal-dependent hydrolase (beta-lactamase superfamily II)
MEPHPSLVPLSPSVFCHADVCNVYVIRSGTRALLIDSGSGSVFDACRAAGIEHVDWVLHTHHHRDQCQVDPRLPPETRIAVPKAEREHFADANGFWQRLQLDDRYLCANVFPTLTENVDLAHELDDYDTFTWEGVAFLVLPTPGHTRGSVTYLATIDDTRWAFCGDLIHSPGRVLTLHDLHWDYSAADGVDACLHSVDTLQRQEPDLLAPSHGQVMSDPHTALGALSANLRRLYGIVGTRYEGDLQPPIASDVQIEQLSPHLLAVTQASANFYALTAETGRMLLFDYGFPSFDHVVGARTRFVEHSVSELLDRTGLTRIDTVIPTHYHDDHVCGINFLKKQHGTELWCPTLFSDVLTRPHAYRLPALWGTPTAVDLAFQTGEHICWEDYSFLTRHTPGHTWYAISLLGEIDGRRVAIAGDQIQKDANGHLRGGGPVYPNRVYSGDFQHGIEAILDYQPELILTGHDGPLEVSTVDLNELHTWCRGLEDSWRALAAFPSELNFALNPAFVRAHPYRTTAAAGDTVEITLIVENHHNHDAEVRLSPHMPPEWTAMPSGHNTSLAAEETTELNFELTSPPDAETRRWVIPIDVEIGEHHFGELAEAIVTIAAPKETEPISHTNTRRSALARSP